MNVFFDCPVCGHHHNIPYRPTWFTDNTSGAGIENCEQCDAELYVSLDGPLGSRQS